MFKEPRLDPSVPMPSEYLLGMVLAWGLLAAEMFVFLLVGGTAPDEALPMFMVTAVYGSLALIVFGTPLVLLTHLVIRRVRNQAAQVAAFSVTGLLTALLPALMLGIGAAGLSIYLAAALAGGVSRSLLIPVTRARALRASARELPGAGWDVGSGRGHHPSDRADAAS